MKDLYPFNVSLKFLMINEETNQTAEVDYQATPMCFPDETNIDLVETAKDVIKAVPKGFRFMTNEESMRHLLEEKMGCSLQQVTIPSLTKDEVFHDLNKLVG